jgi:predicted benzoate:H+ symporter BenE
MSKTFDLFKSIIKILPERIATVVVATSVVTVVVPRIKSVNSASTFIPWVLTCYCGCSNCGWSWQGNLKKQNVSIVSSKKSGNALKQKLKKKLTVVLVTPKQEQALLYLTVPLQGLAYAGTDVG